MADTETSGPITPADLAGLCARVRVELERGGSDAFVCDVAGLSEPDLGTVDALARLQLAAHRLGPPFRLRHVSEELVELLTLCGLDDVLLGVEPRRQAEEREQAGGVEEGVERGDASV